jgi:hypothetical protein
MSFFDDASLVMIPSGYKTSKVYSVKPTDGTGDLTFTRSNDTATRVGPDGLIEKVRTNLLTYSQLFSNAAWTKGNLTLTAGQTDPNGGTNAFLATSTGTNSVWFYQANTGAKTFSIYAKAGTKNFFSIINGGYSNGAGFNLSTQTTTTAGAGSLAKIESVGGGWFRCSVFVSSSTEMLVMLADVSGGSMVIGDTMSFAFAQAETGDIATDYIATTTAAVSVGPVANVPRLDYLNSSCPRLILEPQRTNLFTYSEQLDNAAWLNAGGTTTANTAVSPSGYQDADTLTGARFQSSFGSNTYTLSAFAKKVDGDGTFTLRLDVPANTSAVFNLNNGTIVSTYAGYTSSITAYGNGWYRCTFTSPASTTISNAVLVSANAGVSNTYVYGCQLEVGAYATSYIPTLGASVTRGADAASKTGISSLIGQTEGTLFMELNIIAGNPDYHSMFQVFGDANNRVAFGQNISSTNLFLYINASGVTTFLTTTTPAGSYKIALAYKSGNSVLFVNGVAAITTANTFTFATALSTIFVNNFSGNEIGIFKNAQALLFTTRLTNAQLAELTA